MYPLFPSLTSNKYSVRYVKLSFLMYFADFINHYLITFIYYSISILPFMRSR